jgi:hypothetical protein
MEPFTLALLGGTALGGIYNSSRANSLARENLAYQKERDRQQMRFGQASRQDAYGNVNRYDAALNKWITDLTPAQLALMKAGEHEQTLALTEDAGRNRETRRRAYQRGQDAAEDYNRELAAFRSDTPSEGSIMSDLTGLIMRSRGGGGGRVNTNNFLRQGGNLPVVSGGGGGSGVQDVAEALLEARRGALGEKGQRIQMRNSRLPILQNFAAMSDAGGSGNVPFPNFGSYNQVQDQMSDTMMKALESGAKNIGNAYALRTKNAKIFPDISDFAKGYTALRGGKAQPIASSTTYDSNDYDF